MLSQLLHGKISLLLGASLFLLVGLLTFADSFKFSLFGDDWYILYIIKSQFGASHKFAYFDPTSYFHPWGGQYVIMALLSNLFGYWEPAYYILAFIFRLAVALLVYRTLLYLLNNKLISFLSALAVVVSYAGIESTSSVLHMTVYVSGLFTILAVYLMMRSIDESKIRIFILAMLTFAFALAVAPIRTHGLLFFTLFFDAFYWLFSGKKINWITALRLAAIVATALIVYKLGFFGSFGLGGEWNWFRVDLMSAMVSQGNLTFLTAFLTNLGKVFLPDIFKWGGASASSGMKEMIIFLTLMVEVVLLFIFAHRTRFPRKSFVLSAGILMSLNLAVLYIQKGFFRGSIDDYLASLIGTFVFFLGIWALVLRFVYQQKERLLVGLVIGPVLIITSLIVPLVLMPGGILDSSHRYFTLSLVAVPLIFAGILSLSQTKGVFGIIISLYLIMLIYNIGAVREYFAELLPSRNAETGRKMWDVLFKKMPKPYPDEYLLFYFDASADPAYAHNTVQFGFQPRMAIENQIEDGTKIPAFTNDYPEIISAVTDGQAFKRLGHEVKPIRIDQVYGFKILRGEVREITSEVRADLENYVQ